MTPHHSKLDGPDKAGNDRADTLAKEGVSTGPNHGSSRSLPDNSSVTIGTSELRNTQREADTRRSRNPSPGGRCDPQQCQAPRPSILKLQRDYPDLRPIMTCAKRRTRP
ncbi:hypothetical protein AAFF_G00102660 [Aldrovandia affinis]|uniref:RNase H type-1 domain-containing protein n=1 Tax=Aldrovandia affinis TaxID=143900 RepID=A0AAD7R177_9TELE|nr:hypothetical protein AAFF_G00102660 [Aldrovandia affinis]